jgi:hypothetical protein
MNWDAISAVGEITGATAVVISLIYLAIQVRHNTEVARASTRQAIADSTMTAGSDLIHQPQMAEVVVKDLQRRELNFEEHLQLQTRAYLGLRHFENVHYQFRAGMLSPDEWQGFRQNLKWLLRTRSFEDLWAAQKLLFSKAFQEEICDIQGEARVNPKEFEMDPLLRGEGGIEARDS